MKKTLLCLMMILCLLPFGATAEEAAEGTLYASDFSQGEDGWYGRGATSFPTPDGTLMTVGRTSDWNSPGRDFQLERNTEYSLSVEVKQEETESANFMISVAHSLSGLESYENLAFGSAKKGEWATLTGTYTAGNYDTFVLYVETTGAANLAFEIRNFTVKAPGAVEEVREPAMEIEAADSIPSLKEIYADKFDFGTAVPGFAFRTPQATALILQQFNILTPENEMKPNSVLDVNASKKLVKDTGDETQAAVHLNDALPLLNFAKQNGLKVHGHVMLWGKNPREGQTPEAFFHEGYDTSKPLVSREVMLGRLENYIRSIFEATEKDWPGVIVSWDVLNEAVDDNTHELRSCIWTQVIGEDYPNRAFEYARKYAPEGVRLFYNDYSTAYQGKRSGIIRLLQSLIAEGNIDGYGFQMHHAVADPSMEMIRDSLQEIGDLGLRLRISELDVKTSGNTESSFEAQAKKYANIMKQLITRSEQIDAVQVWGLNDQMSWLRANYPLLFDANWNPKPAFWAVADPNGV